jgi:hypothetical protein
MPTPRLILVTLFAICIAAIPYRQASAQSKRAASGKSPLCTHENALETIKQQVAFTRTFNNSIQRIAVLIRAADLLWPHQQDKARAAFTEAFELATEAEKETQEKGSRSLIRRMQTPDQRYVVIRAVAKRDPAWARTLTRQMLKRETGDRASSNRDSFNNLLTAQRLLHTATGMISTDRIAAFDLARASLNYSASSMLTRFLYRLAEVDQQAADQFYAQALAIYGDKPMREFLYLQAYPFAWRDTLNTPIFAFYHDVPANFVTNQSLQRRFIELLLRRAQQALEAPVDQSDTYQDTNARWLPGPVHLLQGVIKLEPQVRESLPDLLPALTQAREKLFVSLSTETQNLFQQPGLEVSSKPEQTFAKQVESAKEELDVDEHDQLIATLVLGSEKEKLADVIVAIDEIIDGKLRAQLFEWLYFYRATSAIKGKQFDEAERLTAKVEGLEQRAFLHTEIAKGLMNSNDSHAREVLDEAITEAKKSGVNIFAARTLLTVSNLYTKIDLNRSISILVDAIACINRIEAPDFSGEPSLEKTPERRGRGGRYQGEYLIWFYMPGLDPENAFREMAKIDFDNAFSLSSTLNDKFQRAMSTLAVAETCLGHRSTQKSPRI